MACTFCKKKRPRLDKYDCGGCSNKTLLPIGGHHPVPSLSIIPTRETGKAMYYSLMVCLLVFCLVYHFFCRLICHPAQLQSVQIRNWTPSDLFILGSDSETFFRIFNSIQNLIGLNSQLKIKFSTSETSGGWAPKK